MRVFTQATSRSRWTALFAVALLALGLVASGAGTRSASAASTNASEFSKTGKVTANNHTASSETPNAPVQTASQGDTVDWVLHYRSKNDDSAQVSMTDRIQAGQTFLPGSVKAPKGFSVTAPTAGNANTLTATGAVAPDSAKTSVAFTPLPKSFTAASTNGDGTYAIFYGDKIYTVFHHDRFGNQLSCHFKSTGAACQNGTTWAADGTTGVPTTGGLPFGDNASNSVTSMRPGEVLIGDKLYFPAQTDNGDGTGVTGMLCADLKNEQSCGFQPFDGGQPKPGPATFPGLGKIIPTLSGNARVGAFAYYSDGNGWLYCFNAVSGTVCPRIEVDPGHQGDVLTNVHLATETFGGLVFSTQIRHITGGDTVDLLCYNPATQQVCANFPLRNIDPGSAREARYLLPVLNTDGSLRGVCAEVIVGAGFQMDCFATDGTPIVAPYDPNTLVTYGSQGFGSPLVLGTKVYTSRQFTGTSDSIFDCWNFALPLGAGGQVQPCAGFTRVTAAGARNYTIRADTTYPNCLWGVGDAGIFTAFDAVSGGTCNSYAAKVDVKPNGFRCDGSDPQVRKWQQLRLTGLLSSQYSEARVTILDKDGKVVTGFANVQLDRNNPTLDLTAIATTGATAQLSATITLTGITGVPATTLANASADLIYSDDEFQVCFQTKVAVPCDTLAGHLISNDANAVSTGNGSAGSKSDGPAGNQSGTASFKLDVAAVACPPDLHIQKQVDAAAAVAGQVLTYTMTVRNDSGKDLANVSVQDNLATVLTHADYQSVSATPGTATFNAITQLVTWNGSLNANQTATIILKVKVKAPVVANETLPNTVVNASPPGVTSNCEKATPAKECSVTTLVTPTPKLTIEKKVSRTKVEPGQQLDYTITVSNSGDQDLTNAAIEDNLASVLDDAELVANSVKPASATVTGQKLTWTGPLKVGETATITFSVKVKPQADLGDKSLPNTVLNTTPNGVPSNCDQASSDSKCKTNTDVVLPHLQIRKSVAITGPVHVGDTVDYTIVVLNDGATDVSAASIKDDLSGVLDNGTIVAGSVKATAGLAKVDLSTQVLTWTGSLAAKTNATITYSVKITSNDDLALKNVVVNETPGVPSNCQDPASPDPGCKTNTSVEPLPDLTLHKTVDVTKAVVGDTVSYTITVFNNGDQNLKSASITDDLSGALDNASLVDGTLKADVGSATIAQKILSWTGDLKVGELATISYSLQVTTVGDRSMPNTVLNTTQNVPSNCPGSNGLRSASLRQVRNSQVARAAVTSIDPMCQVTTTVVDEAVTPPTHGKPSGGGTPPAAPAPAATPAEVISGGGDLAWTGSSVEITLILGGLVLGLGGLLLLSARRSGRHRS